MGIGQDKYRIIKTMKKAYSDVREVANNHNTDMRTAAFVLGIGRVAKATISRTYIINPKFDQF